jgi:hypothetical protein
VVLRRSLALFVATVVMMVVSPGWAKAGGSENSCGASNAEFGKPPSKERTLGNWVAPHGTVDEGWVELHAGSCDTLASCQSWQGEFA